MDLLDILILLAALIFLREWWRRNSTTGGGPRNLPPGPPGWPIVGNLFQVILERRHFVFVVRDLRKRYGPIFTMRMGQRTLIIVTSADLIHEALVARGPLFATRPPDGPTRLIFSVNKRAINSAPYGPLWRTLRRNFVTEVVAAGRVRQCTWVRDWAIGAHLERLLAEAGSGPYESVSVMDQCRLTVCSILVCLCFGAKIDEDWLRKIELVMKEVMMMTTPKLPDFFPVLSPLFAGQLRAARELRKRQLECVGPLIRARRRYVESGGKDDVGGVEMASPIGAAYVDSLIGMKVAGEEAELTEEELVTLCSEIVNAGTDTTATGVEWALMHLVLDQEIQMKLYEEIVAVAGKDGTITEEQVEKMAYLNAIVKETFRRHPPSHFMLSHAVIKETELGGYTIPTNVNVEFYTAWLTQDPNVWKNPDEFRPERFLEGGEGFDVDMTGNRGIRMMPFGAGRRICPAWTLGVLHIQMLFARMVQAFKWVPVLGAQPDPTETFAFTLVMKNPLKAVILPR